MAEASPRFAPTAWNTVDIERAQDDEVLSVTDRLGVPGGWLYRTQCYIRSENTTETDCPIVVAMVFVPEGPR